MAGQPTTIEFGTIKGLEPIGRRFKASVEPEIERPLDDIVQRVHFREVTWSHRFTLTDPAAELDGVIRFQVCSNGSCLPAGEGGVCFDADGRTTGFRIRCRPPGQAGLAGTGRAATRECE